MTELRRSLTQAGITESVCDIVQKYVGEEETEVVEGVEGGEEGVEGVEGVDGVEVEEELVAEVVVVDPTALRRSLTQAGITESVCDIVEKYTPNLGEGQGGEGGVGGGVGGGSGNLTDLRKSLTQAGITESVIDIVEKYVEGEEVQGEVQVEEDQVESVQAVEVEEEAVEVDQGVEEQEANDEWDRIENNLRQAGLQESDIRLVEKYSPHKSPRKRSVDEVEEEVVETVVVEEVQVVEESNLSPTRLRLTQEEFMRHSEPAQEVVKEYVVGDSTVEVEGVAGGEEGVEEEGGEEGQDGRWGKCSVPAQEILDGYEPTTEMVEE